MIFLQIWCLSYVIIRELVNIQTDLMKQNENEHKNTPDPIYSVNEAEGSSGMKNSYKLYF